MADVVEATDQSPATKLPAAPVADPSTLNRADLEAYASSEFNLTFKSSTSKADMLAAIAEARGPVVKYRVKRPVRHGKRYGIGAIITLAARDAAPLLRTRDIEVATETVPL